jgi:soluble lytic murein transglycosylase-like protein
MIGMPLRAASVVIALLATAHQAHAQAPHPKVVVSACVTAAALFHGVNPLILNAIIFHESRNNSQLVLKNKNGSVDVGLAGLNSVHFTELARYGIKPDQLLDGCVNTYVAAWLLAKQVKANGNTWIAVGSYHSRTPEHRDRYAKQIYSVLRGWGVVQ